MFYTNLNFKIYLVKNIMIANALDLQYYFFFVCTDQFAQNDMKIVNNYDNLNIFFLVVDFRNQRRVHEHKLILLNLPLTLISIHQGN